MAQYQPWRTGELTGTPIDHWTVRHPRSGATLADVPGKTPEEAMENAITSTWIREIADECGGLSLRRMTDTEYKAIYNTQETVEREPSRVKVRFSYEGEIFNTLVVVDEDNDTIMDALCRALWVEPDVITILEIN